MKSLPYTPYFYIITHKATGIKYAGSRWALAKTKFSTNGAHPEEFMQVDGYTTSSEIINSIIDTEGFDAFEVSLLLTELDTVCSVYEYETNFLKIWDIASDDSWFNAHNNEYYTPGSEGFKNLVMKKYGVENVMQLEFFRQKRVNTWLLKYGVDNPMKSKEVQNKRNNTNLERFGNEVPMLVEEVQNKKNLTMKTKYGFEHTMQIPEFQDKSKSTCLEKFGSEFFYNSNTFKEKSKATCLEKYGVEHATQHQDSRNHMSTIMSNRTTWNDGINEFRVSSDTYIQPNWIEGRLQVNKERLSNLTKGFLWYNDGISNFFTPPGDLRRESLTRGKIKIFSLKQS